MVQKIPASPIRDSYCEAAPQYLRMNGREPEAIMVYTRKRSALRSLVLSSPKPCSSLPTSPMMASSSDTVFHIPYQSRNSSIDLFGYFCLPFEIRYNLI